VIVIQGITRSREHARRRAFIILETGDPSSKEDLVERRIINPWSWQDQYGFVQANEMSGIQRSLVCAGQTSVDAEGNAVHQGNMDAQMTLALDNLERVLADAGFTLADVVRLNYYTTDMEAFFAAAEVLGARLAQAGCRPATTLLGVQRLALPELLIEIEATAVA
jgi:enamine deaminase RidA (YjgF/YER057c/UK114 family)